MSLFFNSLKFNLMIFIYWWYLFGFGLNIKQKIIINCLHLPCIGGELSWIWCGRYSNWKSQLYVCSCLFCLSLFVVMFRRLTIKLRGSTWATLIISLRSKIFIKNLKQSILSIVRFDFICGRKWSFITFNSLCEHIREQILWHIALYSLGSISINGTKLTSILHWLTIRY